MSANIHIPGHGSNNNYNGTEEVEWKGKEQKLFLHVHHHQQQWQYGGHRGLANNEDNVVVPHPTGGQLVVRQATAAIIELLDFHWH